MHARHVTHTRIVAYGITNSNAALILLCSPEMTCHRVDISERVTPLYRYVNIADGDLAEVSPEHIEQWTVSFDDWNADLDVD